MSTGMFNHNKVVLNEDTKSIFTFFEKIVLSRIRSNNNDTRLHEKMSNPKIKYAGHLLEVLAFSLI